MSMLIIQACGTKEEKEECKIVRTQASSYGITTKLIAPKTKEELEDGLDSDEPYDYIYVSSHGNEDSLCSDSKSLSVCWLEFGLMLCESGALGDNTVIMLSCCRGGLNQVAYGLFHSCPGIQYVVGPRAKLGSSDMQICYSLLLYMMVQKDLDPVVACEKIRLATDIRFYFSDRLEVETEDGYLSSEIRNYDKLIGIKKERGWDIEGLIKQPEQTTAS